MLAELIYFSIVSIRVKNRLTKPFSSTGIREGYRIIKAGRDTNRTGSHSHFFFRRWIFKLATIFPMPRDNL